MNTHFSLHKNRTLLSAYLSLLKVKHTARYADKLYNEHPYKYSLFGLSKMLSLLKSGYSSLVAFFDGIFGFYS